MKKSFIALSLLAATSATYAQSSVQIYGIMDVSVANLKELGKPSANLLSDGGDAGLKTSRLGFRGAEDLGGGLKAYFKIESRFNPEAGTIQEPMFKGESSVGIAGSFGDVKLGYGTTMLDDVRGLSFSANVFDSAFSPANNGVYKTGGDFTKRATNQIRYETPSVGGFYAGVGHVLSNVDAKDLTAFKLGYKSGPLHVAAVIQDEKGKDNKYTALSGAYDFGAVSVSAGYQNRKGTESTGKDNEFTAGVTVPLGAFSLSFGYANSETQIAGATTSKAAGIGLGASYSMSKRSRLYAGYRKFDVKNGAGIKTADNRLFALGVRHDF